ncbi:hypothetical protein [Methylobacter sp. BBA5.1]|uniref:hypothetical protein n=1 Tax=Methylobacter sp. BBA5.1 TaxID=1495064 RepID=UPI00056B8488|nr:hypothetical protein [Methylobacter sp. BBA5.1]
MTKLSFIESEARRNLGRMPAQKLEALQRNLIALCEKHWSAIRGSEPASGLARALWAVNPHCADLIVDLYGDFDPGFSDTVGHLQPTKVLAALVLAEIERGDAEGARLAHEAMMLFESPQAREIHVESVRSRLRGARSERESRHKHEHHDAFFKILSLLARQTGRCDLQAMVVAVEYLAAIQAHPEAIAGDPEVMRILEFLQDMGLDFQGIEEGRIHYTVRGVPKKPVSGKRLEDMLAQIRGSP